MSLHASKVFFLTMSGFADYLGALGGYPSRGWLRSRGSCHHLFWDHSALGGCLLEGFIPSWESFLPAGGWGYTSGSNGSSFIHTCLAFNDKCDAWVVEDWHPLCLTALRQFWLWWVQWSSHHGSFSHRGMYFLSSISLFFLSCISCMWWYSTWRSFQGAAGPLVGGPINPTHLPWSIYTYGPDGFAWEHLVGHNLNVMAIPFLRAHEQWVLFIPILALSSLHFLGISWHRLLFKFSLL